VIDPTQWPLAQLSPSVETALRIGYGVLLFLQLAVFTAAQSHRFFTTERHGGYVDSTPARDRWMRPAIVRGVMALWILSALGIAFGWFFLPCALLNFALARYFYVHTRWQSILRGMGAPGHMNHWLALLIALLAIAQTVDRSGLLRAMTVLTFRIDFALIMIAAGIYKITAGYAHGDGFERGLVNPWWGFWAKWLRRVPPSSPVFRVLNNAGWLAEVACGTLFFIIPVAPYAAVIFAASFIGIGILIRLGFLTEMVALATLLYFYPGSIFAGWLAHLIPVSAATPASSPVANAIVAVLVAAMAAYLIALPFAYAGMTINFYFKRTLPRPLQLALDRWTQFFGLILWRVFTADIINFFVDVRIRSAGEDRPYMRLRAWDRATGWRYMHVGEFICLASIFTALKYYPNDRSIFERRLVRYARTIPMLPGGSVVFDYHAIRKAERSFEYVHVVRYVVDPANATVSDQILEPGFDPSKRAETSPVSAGLRPGSYAPAR
jgi:hypothetical protein